MLLTEEHPLGEMSIALDAPASMERTPEGYIDVNNELILSPRKFKRKGKSIKMEIFVSFQEENYKVFQTVK